MNTIAKRLMRVLVLVLATSILGHGHKYSSILSQYASVCGIQFCNVSSIALPYSHQNLSDLLIWPCPPCRCHECKLNSDCCPDVGLLYTELKCESDIVYSPYGAEPKFYFGVDDSCPPNSDKMLQNHCKNSTNLIDKLTLAPVTSKSGRTYRNIYCAECNDETDFYAWSFDIKCEEFVDFNFISTYDELEVVIKLKKCIVRYENYDVLYAVMQCEPMRNDLIGRCNMTGTWTSFDEEIEWACRNFQLPFENYRNVFCMICNPPIWDNPIISTCNQTGHWMKDNRAIKDACQLYKSTSATLPFKNIFCYNCNKGMFHKYEDIDGTFLTSTTEEADKITYSMSRGIFTFDFFNRYIGDIAKWQMSRNNGRFNTSFIFLHDQREVNMSRLSTLYTSTYGTNLCGIYNLEKFPSPKDCSCFPFCLILHDCCIDWELDKLLSCSDNQIISRECRYIDQGLNFYCYERGQLIYDLPVYTYQNHYANIFCALCSDDILNQYKWDIQYIKPWNIQITCLRSKPIPIHYQLTVKGIYESAEKQDCKVTYLADKMQNMPCDDKSKTINSCNVSGTWTTTDPDISWACERSNTTYLSSFMGFGNVFCTFCNPGIPLIPRPTETTTHLRTTTVPPFGCALCIEESFNIITYRNLFIISSNEKESSHSQCRKDQVLDKLQNKCRNVTCAEGYTLVNSTCTPLLLKTRNLGYITPLRINLLSEMNPIVQKNLLKQIVNFLREFFQQYLQLSTIPQFRSINMVTNTSCFKNETSWIQILATVELFIEDTVARNEIESKLVNINENNVSVYIDPATKLKMNIILDERASNTKTIITNMAQFTGVCYYSLTDADFRSHLYYRFNLVSELLICKQVILEEGEINIDQSASVITFKSNNIAVQNGKFTLGLGGTARICVDTLKSLRLSESSTNPIFNITITVISMTCLFLTFLTYCLFPSLRSVPGKNNMSLVFSLLFLQGMFTLGSSELGNDATCAIVGVVIHYFLLCTFFCLNVCTFHMFKAFGSITVPFYKANDTRTVIYYCLYAYCMPAIIIATNISITLIGSNHLGYGYQGGVCFITYAKVAIGSVIVPISVICVVNVAFFILTLRLISSTPKIERSSSHVTIHHNSVIYIKLFSITGATWILQIVDAFFPMSYLSVVAFLFNGLQGLYIFLSYIWNDRVWKMYRNLFGGSRKDKAVTAGSRLESPSKMKASREFTSVHSTNITSL